MSEWWSELEEPDHDREKAERLARVLGKLPGNLEEKAKFLEQQMPLLEAEAEAEGFDAERDRKRWNGKMKSLAFRWWRQHWRSGRGEKPQQGRARPPRNVATGERRNPDPVTLRAVLGGQREE